MPLKALGWPAGGSVGAVCPGPARPFLLCSPAPGPAAPAADRPRSSHAALQLLTTSYRAHSPVTPVAPHPGPPWSSPGLIGPPWISPDLPEVPLSPWFSQPPRFPHTLLDPGCPHGPPRPLRSPLPSAHGRAWVVAVLLGKHTPTQHSRAPSFSLL